MADAADDRDPIDVTVVLPVRNEGAHVEAVLADLLAQEGPRERVEFLVVDGMSTDDTRSRVEAVSRRDPRVRLLDNPRRLSSAARAIGAKAARGRYVLYVDGHCRVPSRTLLADLVALFERTGADCLARPQPLEPSTGGLVARAIAAARHSPFGHSAKSEIYGDREGPASPVSSGAAYRREVFEKVGTFDSSFDACEDVEFNTRVEKAGLATWTSPRLAIAYEPRSTFSGLFRQMARYGLGRARLHKKHPSAFTWESLLPAGFLAGLVVLATVLLVPATPAPIRAGMVVLYGLWVFLALAFSVAAAARRGWVLLPFLPIAFLVVHGGLGFGYLRGLLTPRPRPAPEAA